MLIGTYPYPQPTPEQVGTHLLLGEHVMGWSPVDMVPIRGKHTRTVIWVDSRTGVCYAGTPSPVYDEHVKTDLSDYRLDQWSPSTDPRACSELRARVVEKGWRWSVEQLTDIQCMCRIYVRTHPSAPERTFVASGWSLEDAFVRATSAVCETLLAENVRF